MQNIEEVHEVAIRNIQVSEVSENFREDLLKGEQDGGVNTDVRRNSETSSSQYEQSQFFIFAFHLCTILFTKFRRTKI